ncbi:hypothetical protein [uncultured Polaribacter sp.]|uniref:hypothetical protein n=1 Tax=uncultured Polaribacter sp. TaxID=174711 RepID=UPI00262867B6|nr:hypothetical protein [uncultured Polaribacter sp.]
MKTIYFFIATVLFVSGSVFSQANIEKQAKRTTKEMSEVMVLNDEQSTKILDINMRKFTAIAELKEKYKDDPTTMKTEIKKATKPFAMEATDIVGQEKIEIWRAYLKEKKKQKNK